MKPLNEAGAEILKDNPGSIYFFCGAEYGLKDDYMKHLEKFYGRSISFDSISDVIELFSHRSLIPRPASLYIVRYDSDFLSALDKKLADRLIKSKIDGTLVCIYEEDKVTKKLDKFFPDHTVSFEPLGQVWIKRYLMSDYKEIDEYLLSSIAVNCLDYQQGKMMCEQIDGIDFGYDDRMYVPWTIGLDNSVEEDELRIATAAKNINKMLSIYENYKEDKVNLMYCVLNVLTDLEKLHTRRADIDITKYQKLWSLEDIYNYYDQILNQLYMLRQYPNYSVDHAFCFGTSLLKFNKIPSVGAVNSWN